ncbi:MAG: NAD(P)H-quinone oxidoreductase [Gemmatimonadota bacterium]|jgi:putative PIG3 family NAD(P)H quinone oxidoreductase
MRAVTITGPGDPDVLHVRRTPRAEPAAGEVLVKVRASGVNRADLLQRQGAYPAPPGWPAEIPGLEYAGTVEAVGEGVDPQLADVGDRVMGLVGGGGYAEAVAVHARTVVPVPDGVDLEDAGAIPEVFMTAFDALFLQCGLVAGERVLIHAVGSGVGTAAVQLARSAGAVTLGTSRTAAKLDRAVELGLDHPVAGGDRDWHEEVLELTDGRGVDVVLDLVGAPYLGGNLEVLATGARWIVVGVPGGATGSLDLRGLMRKRASITGTVLRARPLEEKALLARAFADRVVPLLARGDLRPVVDRTYPPEKAADAHRRMEANLNFGKLVLLW